MRLDRAAARRGAVPGLGACGRTRHHSLLYDLGPGRADGFNTADHILTPALRAYALDMPQRIVVSHVDQDHSGGLHSRAFAELSAGRLISGMPEDLRRRYALDAAVVDCHQTDAWRWDGVDFEFLAATDEIRRNGNSNSRSCVLRISSR